MNAFFIILRILTGLSSLGALIPLSLVVFLRDTASTAKQGLHLFAYVSKLFATAFTKDCLSGGGVPKKCGRGRGCREGIPRPVYALGMGGMGGIGGIGGMGLVTSPRKSFSHASSSAEPL